MTGLDSHPVPESVDSDEWRLRATGAVAEPLRLAAAELRTLPETGVTNDFACVEGGVPRTCRGTAFASRRFWHGHGP